MSTYESAYPSLLQGVSQQLPDERLPGQLTAQVNMLSDPVTGLRRRPGLEFKLALAWPSTDKDRVAAWYGDVAGAKVHILLNTNTGNLRVLNEALVQEASLDASAYINNTTPDRVRGATVGNEFFLCNLDKIPTLVYGGGGTLNYQKGFFYILAGQFSTEYSITLQYGSTTVTESYTTPDGTGTGDAALAAPAYIAGQLVSALAATPGIGLWQSGPYVFVNEADATTQLSITTNQGSSLVITSRAGSVRQVGDLPAQLNSEADGYIVQVGDGHGDPQYYKYSAAAVAWEECGAVGSPSSITNTPISLAWNGTAWVLDTSPFSGRNAGNDDSNKVHEWMTYGITGMSTHQGRLCIMSGPLVSFSESAEPRNFFRTTVTSVVSSDPIEIGSSANSSAAYEWAIPFQKDLVLFSRAYQAVVPSNNVPITPATAMVVPTSAHETDTTSSPITLGRTLLYASPRSEDFFGALEMIPSQYTDSQYTSQDATPHLPRFMPGRCRFAASSSVASIALMAPSGDTKSLVVHEYLWDGDQKVQQAWHQWLFEYDVAAAYFAGSVLMLVFSQNGITMLCSIDPRAGSIDTSGERRPYLDFNLSGFVSAGYITIPSWMLTFDPAMGSKLRLIASTGALAGEPIGATLVPSGTELLTVRSWPTGNAKLGIPYYSGFIPSPPVVRDYNKQPIHTGKATLVRYLIGTKNSSEFEVTVNDAYSTADALETSPLTWSSPELELGRGLFSDQGLSVVPCRTDLRTTEMEVSTQATGELNISALGYVARFNTKIKRM